MNADKKFTHNKIQLQKGDNIYLFTDGYVDQFGGPKGKKFMKKNFYKLLVQIEEKPMHEQKNILTKTITEWRGDIEQVDDVLVMGVRIV